MCANAHCIPLAWTCDNEDDCGDGSDEEAANCLAEQGGDGEALNPEVPDETQTTVIPGSGESTTRNPTTAIGDGPEESLGTSSATSTARSTLETIVDSHDNRDNVDRSDLATRLSPQESTTTVGWEENIQRILGLEDDRATHEDSSTRHIIQENPGKRGPNQVHTGEING